MLKVGERVSSLEELSDLPVGSIIQGFSLAEVGFTYFTKASNKCWDVIERVEEDDYYYDCDGEYRLITIKEAGLDHFLKFGDVKLAHLGRGDKKSIGDYVENFNEVASLPRETLCVSENSDFTVIKRGRWNNLFYTEGREEPLSVEEVVNSLPWKILNQVY